MECRSEFRKAGRSEATPSEARYGEVNDPGMGKRDNGGLSAFRCRCLVRPLQGTQVPFGQFAPLTTYNFITREKEKMDANEKPEDAKPILSPAEFNRMFARIFYHVRGGGTYFQMLEGIYAHFIKFGTLSEKQMLTVRNAYEKCKGQPIAQDLRKFDKRWLKNN